MIGGVKMRDFHIMLVQKGDSDFFKGLIEMVI